MGEKSPLSPKTTPASQNEISVHVEKMLRTILIPLFIALASANVIPEDVSALVEPSFASKPRGRRQILRLNCDQSSEDNGYVNIDNDVLPHLFTLLTLT